MLLLLGMMFFKDFLQWVRNTGERYVVLDADGEPEFVIEPFQQKKISTVEKINETLAAVAENERQEVAGWDAMAETLHHDSPSPVGEGRHAPYQREASVSGGEVNAGAESKSHDEPTFQFETIDE